MQEIQFIAPVALHDEMLRLRNEKQMDFLESLTGMDWGAADEKDTPEKLHSGKREKVMIVVERFKHGEQR